MKIKLKTIESINDNDCWNVAISQFLAKPYKDVRKDLKPFLVDDGGVDTNVIEQYLLGRGCFSVRLKQVDLINVVNLIRGNDCLICGRYGEGDYHAFYISNNTIFDFIEEREIALYFETFKVSHIIFHKIIER